jgi:membrane glycosyltransferase
MSEVGIVCVLLFALIRHMVLLGWWPTIAGLFSLLAKENSEHQMKGAGQENIGTYHRDYTKHMILHSLEKSGPIA